MNGEMEVRGEGRRNEKEKVRGEGRGKKVRERESEGSGGRVRGVGEVREQVQNSWQGLENSCRHFAGNIYVIKCTHNVLYLPMHTYYNISTIFPCRNGVYILSAQ